MGQLLLLFIVLPAVELALLIEIGRRIGTLETLAIIVVTGFVGAAMARSQGLRVVSEVRVRVQAGELPADSLVDGVMILIASALLVTPGVLTDAFGFLCLVPAFRSRVKRNLMKRFEQAVREGRAHVGVSGTPGGDARFYRPTGFPGEPADGGPVIDVTPRREDDA